MYNFTDSIEAWNTDAFARTVKKQVEDLPSGSLPLYQCTTQGGMVDDSDITATVLSVSADLRSIEVRLGVFFHEIVGGCSCHDDPVVENGYAEIMLNINKLGAQAVFSLADK